jgi:hypothetical protein
MPNGINDPLITVIREEFAEIKKDFKSIIESNHKQDIQLTNLENRMQRVEEVNAQHLGSCPLNKNEIRAVVDERLPEAVDDVILKKIKVWKAIAWAIGMIASLAAGGQIYTQLMKGG